MNYIVLFFIILLLEVIIVAGFILWNEDKTEEDESYDEMKEIIKNDAHLNRLLIVEIINNKQNSKEISEEITFEKMNSNMSMTSKILIKSFVATVTSKIINLFQRRNEILREYY